MPARLPSARAAHLRPLLARRPKLAACAADIATAYRTLAACFRAGGRLRRLAHPCVRVPAQQTHLIQELHLSVYHTRCLALETEFFP